MKAWRIFQTRAYNLHMHVIRIRSLLPSSHGLDSRLIRKYWIRKHGSGIIDGVTGWNGSPVILVLRQKWILEEITSMSMYAAQAFFVTNNDVTNWCISRLTCRQQCTLWCVKCGTANFITSAYPYWSQLSLGKAMITKYFSRKYLWQLVT